MSEYSDSVILSIISLMERAKGEIDLLRVAKVEQDVDGRALSIAVTHLETAQLWVANARK